MGKIDFSVNKFWVRKKIVRVINAAKWYSSVIINKEVPSVISNRKTMSKMYLMTKDLDRKITDKRIKFVTVNDLCLWTCEWIKTFPISFDVIIGIPRSGMIIGGIIASILDKPLASPESLKAVLRKSGLEERDSINALLVDDTVVTGKHLSAVLAAIRACSSKLNITTGALIAREDSKHLVDLSYKLIPHPRIFEWNLIHYKRGKIATDLDGVICENCPPGVDSDEDSYIEWIKNAKPFLIPSFELDIIVSNRLEKYRAETEKWLRLHGVQYKQLILWSLDSKEYRKGQHAVFKSDILLAQKPDEMWESSLWQAEHIWAATRIPTLCVDEMVLFS
jgi:hypoxanthine phosphoribosyltransferase